MDKKYPKTITITELPTIGRNTQLQIFLEEKLINQFVLNPSEEFIENQVNVTIRILDEFFVNEAILKKEFRY